VPESLVLLHGFSGTHRVWDGVAALVDRERYLPLAIDLPGHGSATDAPRPITFDGCVRAVLAQTPDRFALCGYSLGGRVAMHVALAAPERVGRLLIIAANPGIEDEHERSARREADRAVADRLEHEPFEDFIEQWRAEPLFALDPPRVGELAREDQRRNRPDALAAVMRGIGAGEMLPLWSRLGELSIPVAILVGDRDQKFTAIGRRMAGLIPGARLSVAEGGHRLPLENPAAVVAALEGLHAEAGSGG
jgi:2-succinyl-6-hydroxy-2,4-cyclohexadiene-1-carboxylate synthase